MAGSKGFNSEWGRLSTSLLLALFVCFCWSVPAESAYRLRFRNGTTIEVESYQDQGDTISYSRHGGVITIAKTQMLAIENLTPSAAPSPPNISFTVPPISSSPSAADPSPSPPSGPLTYSIVEKKDNKVLTGVRLVIRVQVSREATESELLNIGEQIIRQEKGRRPINAIELFYYLPDTETSGSYTAGKAVWAPNGDWGAAYSTPPGDYSKHKHVVTAGNALAGTWKYRTAAEVPEATRRRIFYDLIAAEDKLTKKNRFSRDTQRAAHEEVAGSYGLDYDTVSKIWGEGLVKGWRMPSQ